MSPANIVVIKIYADWCGHCTNIKDPYEELQKNLKKKFPNITFEDVEDKVKETKLKEIYGNDTPPSVNSYPTFLFFNKDTKKTEIYDGGADIEKIEKFITENMKKTTGGRRRRRARRGTQRGGYKWSVRVSRKKTKRTASKRGAAAAAAVATSYTKK